MTQALTVLEDSVWVLERPIKVVEGESIVFTLEAWATITSTPTCVVYRNRSSTAVTSTVMPSGSHTYSGTTATLKPATAMVGGSTYTFAVTLAIGGDTRIRKFKVICQKDEATL